VIRAVVAAALGALVAGCGDTTSTTLTQLNLDRPVDIAFACYGGLRLTGGQAATPGQQVIPTAQPSTWCDLRSSQVSPPNKPDNSPGDLPVPPGQETIDSIAVNPPNWYGFILQSASGTVALSSFPAQPSDRFPTTPAEQVQVLDADGLTPGKNAISVGEDPVAIATDASGCFEVVANAGSCDLSVLDVNSAVAAATDSSLQVKVDRVPVKNKAGAAILSRPAAMVAQPGSTVVGNACPVPSATTPPDLVYIAYPSCHLVAAVDISTGSGVVVGGVQYSASGVPVVLSGAALDSVSCPAECSGAVDPQRMTPRPVALDLKFDPLSATTSGVAPGTSATRIAVGAENSASLAIIELGPDALPQSVSQIALENKTTTLGVTAVSLSPVIQMGGTNGIDDVRSPGGPGQYIYAVASDNTVRVADVLTVRDECDTQVDGRLVRGITRVAALQCFAVHDPAKPSRRPGARGPGIELLDDSVPTSVAIVRGNRAPATDTTTGLPLSQPGTLVGYFAIITTSSGRSYVVNVDDDSAPDTFMSNEAPTDPALDPQHYPASALATAPALIMAHQLRDALGNRGAAAASDDLCGDRSAVINGGPHITTIPARTLPAGTLPADYAREMPALHQVGCKTPTGLLLKEVSELQFGAPVDVRDQAYPDLRSVASEAWTLTWEGPLSANNSPLSLTTIDGPQVRSGTMQVDKTGMRLIERTRPFCEMGVEPFDIVQFRGCNPANGNTDCPSDYTCYVHPNSKVSGLGSCMRSDEAERLATACFDFLATFRRYTVGKVDSGALTLLPRKHELYATPINGCVDDAQCDGLARYVADRNPAADHYTANVTTWECRTDDQRAPINPDPAANKRCIQTCGFHSPDRDQPGYDGLERDADCTSGTICVGATAAGARGTCMESVLPPQSCVNGPQMFDVRASEAFTVIGSTSGYLHPIIEQGGTCCRAGAPGCGQPSDVPLASRLLLGRIPLKAPACDPTADPITGALPGGGFEPNPCSTTLVQTEQVPKYDPPIPVDSRCSELSVSGMGMPDSSLKLADRTAAAIKFSNRQMSLHLVDPTYPGDMVFSDGKSCVQDRRGTFDQVSLIPPGATPTAIGYQLGFDQKAGFTPMTLPGLSPAYPIKVVRGPSDSIWVLDAGDVLSSILGVSSTRGQVFRVESINVNAIHLLQ
jgi:hypothetical protein